MDNKFKQKLKGYLHRNVLRRRPSLLSAWRQILFVLILKRLSSSLTSSLKQSRTKNDKCCKRQLWNKKTFSNMLDILTKFFNKVFFKFRVFLAVLWNKLQEFVMLFANLLKFFHDFIKIFLFLCISCFW